MKQYIVDAFTDKLFCGNQAAVCVLEKWISDELMQNIAKENNFSETAFCVKNPDNSYKLRWFTPSSEIDFCGHATLGTSFILFNFYEKNASKITFKTMRGNFFVKQSGEFIEMDFPAFKFTEISVSEKMTDAFGKKPEKAFYDRDLLLVYDDEDFVRNVSPDFEKIKQLDFTTVAITSPGKDFDCVSRVFAPKEQINEDPVTGSTHCMIAPYWASRLGKNEINAYQASSRGGKLKCVVNGERVLIFGKAVLFSVCELNVK